MHLLPGVQRPKDTLDHQVVPAEAGCAHARSSVWTTAAPAITRHSRSARVVLKYCGRLADEGQAA
jgi:hypothetical protein